MNTSFQLRLEEIKLCLHNEDLNRTGQRLLDLTYDYEFQQSFRNKALELRKKYNEGKQLGTTKNTNEHLIKDYTSFYESISHLQEINEIKISNKTTIAKISNIGKHFHSLLHNFRFSPISLELIKGNIIGLVGENGNGKTTLLRMICGELAYDEGDIEYYFDATPTKDWQEIKKKIAFIPQRIERWYGTANEKISFDAAIKGFKGELNEEKVNFIIHRMGLSNFRELKWSELSSGYKLRFEIAMALVWEPSILILDEPLANLDIQAQELLLQDLRNLANSIRNPVSIILSSQQLHEVETIADQIIFLKNGKSVFNGSLEEFKKLDVTKTYEISGSFTYQQLQNVLKEWKDLKIEQSASAFTITCSENHQQDELFQLLINNKMSINYFRNISGSTKKLFNDKY